jgi:hypothetical protein
MLLASQKDYFIIGISNVNDSEIESLVMQLTSQIITFKIELKMETAPR